MTKKIVVILLILYYMGLNKYRYDYEGYKLMFEKPFLYSSDIGYNYLAFTLKKVGANFQSIYILLAIFTLITLFRVTKIYEIKLEYLCFFYFLFPFLMDTIQIRNTIAYFLVINSLIFLSQKREGLSYFCILLSVTFHRLAFIYIIFIFFRRIITKKNLVVLVCVSFIFFYYLNTDLVQHIPRLHAYLREILGIKSLIKWSIIFYINYLIISYFKKEIIVVEEEQYKILNLIEKLNYFNFICLPLCVYFEEFTRIGRNFSIYIYIYGLIVYSKSKNYCIITILFLYSFVFFSIYWYLGIKVFNMIVGIKID